MWFSDDALETLDPLHHWESTHFQTCSQGSEKRKNGSEASKNMAMLDPEKHKNNICEKLFLQYFPCEHLVLRAPGKQMSTQESVQKKPVHKPEPKLEIQASVPHMFFK